MQELDNAPWLSQLVVSNERMGVRLFTMEPLSSGATWMELDIQPAGTLLFGDNPLVLDEVPNIDQVVSTTPVLKGWTPAKAQVTYALAGGDARTVRFDIGNGVTVRIPPTNRVEADLLVWSDEDLDEVVAPPNVGTLRGIDFATTVSCKATAVPSGSERPLPRFTQCVYLPGADVTNRNAQVKLENQVDAVQIYASAVGALDLVIGDITAAYRTEITDVPVGLPDGLSGMFPLSIIDFDTAHVSRLVPVPHSHANVVRLANTAGNKNANVIVVQEIY